MKQETLYKIEELLCKEIEKFEDKDRLTSSGELQYLDTALHAMKNLNKIMDGGEEEPFSMSDGNSSYYSRRDGSYRGGSYRGYSRDGGSYADGGSYRGGSYRRRRDSMGRFSRSEGGGMIERLKNIMDETDDPNEREELREFISGIENR
jgi:hypothetical protein